MTAATSEAVTACGARRRPRIAINSTINSVDIGQPLRQSTTESRSNRERRLIPE
jgi:hypothetical protein